jgi:thiol-disulfide isomerase/thioredoxin
LAKADKSSIFAHFPLHSFATQHSFFGTMAATPSTMIPLGTQAPDFTLPEVVYGKPISLEDVRGAQATVIMFICNHCPYVLHINEELVRLANDYTPHGCSFVAISSNDVELYPDDAPDKMKYHALEFGYPFPYCYDETQDVARAYKAACTPDFFVFDAELRCVYRGQFDDARPGNGIPPNGHDVRAALDALLRGEAVSQEQKPSIGCNIKWKKS